MKLSKTTVCVIPDRCHRRRRHDQHRYNDLNLDYEDHDADDLAMSEVSLDHFTPPPPTPHTHLTLYRRL